jgi:hypothetical protein
MGTPQHTAGSLGSAKYCGAEGNALFRRRFDAGLFDVGLQAEYPLGQARQVEQKRLSANGNQI